MNTIGKKIRWNRFINNMTGRGIILPIDHGFTRGPIQGIENVLSITSWLDHPAIKGVLAHKGVIQRLGAGEHLSAKGVMIHLNGMISTSQDLAKKIQLTSVAAAVRYGADAVSIDLNFDGINDEQNVQLLGRVVDDADQWGLPVLVMISDKLPSDSETKHIGRLRHFIRSCMELGADAVKVSFQLSPKYLSSLLNQVAEDIPIFLAGGSLIDSDDALIENAKAAFESGASGLCIGRNIFQRSNPRLILDRLTELV